MTAGRCGLRVEISGAVQGVGFRPFVYRLATELALTGWVINDARGVVISVEGPASAIECFLERLKAEPPPHAVIHRLDWRSLPVVGYDRFTIRTSHHSGGRTVAVLPDLATCPDCLAEVRDPADRRHRYAFTNCTRCGPRFSIIRRLPYDRPNTTMRAFAMCPSCQAEYGAPLDRRFHAQPNACPACGPRLALWCRDESGRWIEAAAGDPALRLAAAAIGDGAVAAVKGLGGFHLVVDAANPAAVGRLRDRKRRPDKPLALMAADLEHVRRICVSDAEAEALLAAPQAPIVLLPRRPPQPGDASLPIADAVAPGNPTLGVMLPATPLHHLLLAEVGRPVVATSGNVSDEPVCIDEQEAVQRLGPFADLFLVHDRPIARQADDSVVQIVAGAPRLLRRARGYAPLPVRLRAAVPPILAVGAQFKNTIALSVADQVFISQHIGDLATPQALAAFERVIADFLDLYAAEPVAIAHDLHPDYRSSHWAEAAVRERGCRGIPVQHHHAHFAACLAENQVQGTALGVVWDGTGHGADGTIWGGEFLLGDASAVQRVAHVRPFRLPGGDACAREPRRVALALLLQAFGAAALAWEDLAAVASFSAAERALLATMLARRVNAPSSSSIGRLFDGMAALTGLAQRCSFEGQAAMALQFAAEAAGTESGSYPLPLSGAGPPYRLDWQPMIAAVVEDVRRRIDPGIIAARFHNALIDGLADVARRIGQPRVALSGGCFQNRLLVERATGRLRAERFEVILHAKVPSNDGGISLGQVAVAAAAVGSG
jgi:hydrogenase maturation protein HypF